MKDFKIGIQLYTVREPLNTDFKGVLRELAAMGYQGMEFAGMYGEMEPQELAIFLRELKVSVCGMHLPLEDILDGGSKSYQYAKALGCRYLMTSLCGNFVAEFDSIVEKCNEAGRIANQNGMVFAYHNHAQEFEPINGIPALDMFYSRTSPQLVKAELDTYWIKKGGGDPVAYLSKYASRLPLIHLKDMDKTDGSFTEVGTGGIDLPGVLEIARVSAAEWVIYEQDICKRPVLESARISVNNIKKYCDK
jgi:sugar phosphate isomerase/epimerase